MICHKQYKSVFTLTKISNKVQKVHFHSILKAINIRHLNKIIDGIEDGTRPIAEHDLIEVADNSIAAVKGHYEN